MSKYKNFTLPILGRPRNSQRKDISGNTYNIWFEYGVTIVRKFNNLGETVFDKVFYCSWTSAIDAYRENFAQPRRIK